MPPWFAAPTRRASTRRLPMTASLTEADKKDLLAWLGGDLKKGDPADAPLPRKYDRGWLIGKPDAMFQIPTAISIKAEGTMPYQNVRVDTNLRRGSLGAGAGSAADRPRSRSPRFGLRRAQGQRGSAAMPTGFFAAYVPGNNTLIYPDGYAKKLPKGATLPFQIHYTPNGKATTDQTRLGLIFAKEAAATRSPRRRDRQRSASRSPPGADNHEVTARIPVPFDAHGAGPLPARPPARQGGQVRPQDARRQDDDPPRRAALRLQLAAAVSLRRPGGCTRAAAR